MPWSRYLICIAAVCMLACAAAAPYASAEQRAYTCEPVTTGATFSDEHCVTSSAGPAGFKHTLIAAANTKITATNAKTAEMTKAAAVSVLEGTLPPEVAIQCTAVSGNGELTNAAASVTGTLSLKYTGCTVLKPVNRGCMVKGGEITTRVLKFTTVGQAAGSLKFQANAGVQIAAVPIEACQNNVPPTAEYPVTGSFVASLTGATITTTAEAVTKENTLKFAGNKAGLEGTLTLSMEGGNAIAFT